MIIINGNLNPEDHISNKINKNAINARIHGKGMLTPRIRHHEYLKTYSRVGKTEKT